jgi:hypothetical protein
MSDAITPSGETIHPNDNLQHQPLQGNQDASVINDNMNMAVPPDRIPRDEFRTVLLKGSDGIKDSEDAGRYLDPRPMVTLHPSADTLFSDLSLYTGNVSHSRHVGPPLRSPSPILPGPSSEPLAPPPKRSLRRMIRTAWLHSKGMLMVILAQFFGASMNVMTQLLEKDGTHGKAMHPFQVSWRSIGRSRNILTILCRSYSRECRSQRWPVICICGIRGFPPP